MKSLAGAAGGVCLLLVLVHFLAPQMEAPLRHTMAFILTLIARFLTSLATWLNNG